MRGCVRWCGGGGGGVFVYYFAIDFNLLTSLFSGMLEGAGLSACAAKQGHSYRCQCWNPTCRGERNT